MEYGANFIKPSEMWKEIKPKIGEMLMTVNNIETQAEKAQKEAYENGFIAGHLKAEKSGQSFYEDGYKRGLADAWEAARKIAHCFLWGSYQRETGRSSACAQDVLDYYSAAEAIEEIRAYEQAQKEKEQEQKQLHVGDEVNAPFGKAIVVNIDFFAKKIWLVYADGHGGFEYFKDAPTKTGRHFPEIAEVLKKMKE